MCHPYFWTRILDVVSALSTSRITITPLTSHGIVRRLPQGIGFSPRRLHDGGNGMEGFARSSFRFPLQITFPPLLHTRLSPCDNREQAARDLLFCLRDGASFLSGPTLGWSRSRALFGACKNSTDCRLTSAKCYFSQCIWILNSAFHPQKRANWGCLRTGRWRISLDFKRRQPEKDGGKLHKDELSNL